MDFVENILIIAKKRGITDKELCKVLGQSTSYINDCRKGKSKMKAKDIILISEMFNISADYLLFGKEREENTKISRMYIKLNNENKIKVEGYAEGLLAEQEQEQEQEQK